MRLHMVLLLVLAMVCGTTLTFFIGRVWFPVKPTVFTKPVPTSQVLIAKKDIPAGARVSGDMIRFSDVPIDSIPIGALVDFFQVYDRKALYPIAAGTPICDLDLGSSAPEFKEILPFGGRVVPVRIGRVLNEQESGNPRLVLANSPEGTASVQSLIKAIGPNDLVDLFVIEPSQGNRKDSKGNLNGDYLTRKAPRLVLSGLRLFTPENSSKAFSDPQANPTESVPQLTLLMTTDQIDTAKKAAKEGRLQLIVRTPGEKRGSKETTGFALFEEPQTLAFIPETPVAPAASVALSPKLENPVASRENQSPVSAPQSPLATEVLETQLEPLELQSRTEIAENGEEPTAPTLPEISPELSIAEQAPTSLKRLPSPFEPESKTEQVSNISPSSHSSRQPARLFPEEATSRADTTEKKTSSRPVIEIGIKSLNRVPVRPLGY